MPAFSRVVTWAPEAEDRVRTRSLPIAHEPSSVPRFKGPSAEDLCSGLVAVHSTCTVLSHDPVGWSANIAGRSTAASTTSLYSVAGASMARYVFQCALRKYAAWKLLDPGAVTR